MKRTDILLMFWMVMAALVTLTGCGINPLLGKVPDYEFKRFEYHRAGNATSTHITAENAKRVDGKQEIGSLKITSDYGPFANFNIVIDGFSRDVPTSAVEE